MVSDHYRSHGAWRLLLLRQSNLRQHASLGGGAWESFPRCSFLSPGSRVSGDIRNQQALKLGESVSYGGWTIEVVDAGRFGDVVKLSKS